MGSPVIRMRKNTSVVRIQIVGMMRRKRTMMYRPSPDPLDFFVARFFPRPSARTGLSTLATMISHSAAVVMTGGRALLHPPSRLRSVDQWVSEPSLAQQGEAELERRVERLVDARHVRTGHGDLRALQVRQGRQLLGQVVL